jgi:sulfate permease, SulP family
MYRSQDFTRNLQGDLMGGITAAVVALPLALAFGISSGAGAVSGLYGAIIIGFFAAIFGGTPSQISGPTGPMTVVMAALIAKFTSAYPDQGLALAFSTVCLGGLLQVLMGYLRLGKYIVLVSYPVISGFMTGIGAIIILLQIGPFLGFPAGGSVIAAMTALPWQIANFDPPTLFVAGLTLTMVFLWSGKMNRLLPSPLLALVFVTLVVEVFFPGASITRIGEFPSSLPSFQLPIWRLELLQEMFVGALVLATLGSIDSLLTSLVADNISGTQHDSDRELIGQGMGNAISGLFGGLSGAGATMRTVVNMRAGGNGPLSGTLHALVLFIIISGGGAVFEKIPLCVLAGILVKVGFDIIDWQFLKRLHRLRIFPVALMMLVFILTVFVDLIVAVFAGVFIQNLVTVSRMSDFELDRIRISDGTKFTDFLSDEELAKLMSFAGKAVLIRITGPISYAVGRRLSRRFAWYRNKSLLVIDISDATVVGVSTALVIEAIMREMLSKGARVRLVDAHATLRDEFQRLGLLELIGQKNCLDSVIEALSPEA